MLSKRGPHEGAVGCEGERLALGTSGVVRMWASTAITKTKHLRTTSFKLSEHALCPDVKQIAHSQNTKKQIYYEYMSNVLA